MIDLEVSNPKTMIKIDDTNIGIKEGKMLVYGLLV